jgi:ATP-dependent DNA helicase RecQ
VEELLGVSGVGRMKLAAYGERFVELLNQHESEHGRPDNVPAAPLPRVEKVQPRSGELSGTEQASLDLFRQNGSVSAVAEARSLKAGTIYGHLTKAIALGHLEAGEVTGLTRTELSRIEEALGSMRFRGMAALGAVSETLGGEFSYEILRCVQAAMLRERDGA